MPRECAAVGCTELQTKGSLFSFHTFPKDSSRRKLHRWRFELEIVPSRLPCGHTHRHEFFFTKGYRSRIARLSLGWSLVDGRNGLFGWNLRPCQFYKEYIQTDQRTQKYILTPWHPVQRLKLKKGKNRFPKKPSRKRTGNQQKRQMYTQILSKNELVINAAEEILFILFELDIFPSRLPCEHSHRPNFNVWLLLCLWRHCSTVDL